MEIILHCGLPKTGSTYLQHVLAANKDALARHGICYPTMAGTAHFDLAPYHFKPTLQYASNMNFYVEWAIKKGFERIVFSNELFLGADFSQYECLKKHKFRIIFYIRYFTAGMESWYKEMCRSPYDWFKSKVTPDLIPFKLLDTLGAPFLSRVEAYSYDLSKKTGIVKHFLGLLGIQHTKEFQVELSNPRMVNTSVYAAEAAFLAELKPLPLPLNTRFDLYLYWMGKCLTSLRKDYLVVSPQQYAHVAREESRSLGFLSALMGYPEYTRDSLCWLEKKEVTPWRRLPRTLWHEIFHNLPGLLQAAIRNVLPPGEDIYTATGNLLSPDFFPGYLLKSHRGSQHYPVTFQDALTEAGKTPWNVSSADSPSLFSEPSRWVKETSLLRVDGHVIKSENFYHRYKEILLTELANKVDAEAMAVLMREKDAYDTDFLSDMISSIVFSTYREYLAEQAARLFDQDVYFWGCGDIYESLHIMFSGSRVKAIIVDQEKKAPIKDGIPVFSPNEILDEAFPLPIIIFSQKAKDIKNRIFQQYPSHADIVMCTMN